MVVPEMPPVAPPDKGTPPGLPGPPPAAPGYEYVLLWTKDYLTIETLTVEHALRHETLVILLRCPSRFETCLAGSAGCGAIGSSSATVRGISLLLYAFHIKFISI